MDGMNIAILCGNIGADCELRFTQSGTPVANIRLATTRKWLDSNDVKQEETEWHSVVIWGKRAEGLAQYLTTGARVAVRGRIATRSWEDKDGNKRYATEIVAEDIMLMGGPSGRDDQSGDRGERNDKRGDRNDKRSERGERSGSQRTQRGARGGNRSRGGTGAKNGAKDPDAGRDTREEFRDD